MAPSRAGQVEAAGANVAGHSAPVRSSKKKVGGVKRQTHRETQPCGCIYEYPGVRNRIGVGEPVRVGTCGVHLEPSVSQHPVLRKRLGGVKQQPPVRSFQRDCELCEGEVIGETWVHSPGCKNTIVVWNELQPEAWHCPFECPPVQLASGITHHHRCKFWNRTDKTPFGANVY